MAQHFLLSSRARKLSLKEKNIQDYYLYQKSFRNHIEQEQKDIGKADARNWEVL